MGKWFFISYATKDGDFADSLKGDAEKRFKTWIDLNIHRSGADWRSEINQAIEAAFALIVIMTVILLPCRQRL